jgi:hypothetical protein
MAESKRVYRDAYGVRRTLIFDDDGNRLAVQTEQAIDGLLDHTAAFRDIPQPGPFKKVASVPIEVYEKSVLEGWDDGDWAKWLNDPDNKLFRTWPGRC